jgi:protein phosphatase
MMRAAGGSETGQVRTNNEDAWLCDADRGLFIVADGMGGQEAGEQASATAIAVLNAALCGAPLREALAGGEAEMQGIFTAALADANTAITALVDTHPGWAGLGSTALVAILRDRRLYLANVGDSRAYLLLGDAVTCLTQDHSVAARMVADGLLEPEALRTHRLRNTLTQSLGDDENPEPDCITLELPANARLLLCTDGLWEQLDDDEIAGILRFSASPQEAAYSLLAAADDAGGDDNITAVTVFME